jgi:hypothetical protein
VKVAALEQRLAHGCDIYALEKEIKRMVRQW